MQDTSPQHRPVALPVACKHPPHLPLRACRPPFRCHCRHMCRSFHSRGGPHCAPRFMRPTPPHLRPPLHAGGCRRDSAPLVPSSLAMPHARGRAACKGRGKDQGGCTQGEGLHARRGGGFVSEQASGAAHKQKGACTLSAPPAPSRST